MQVFCTADIPLTPFPHDTPEDASSKDTAADDEGCDADDAAAGPAGPSSAASTHKDGLLIDTCRHLIDMFYRYH